MKVKIKSVQIMDIEDGKLRRGEDLKIGVALDT